LYDRFMTHDELVISVRLLVALIIGGLIGLERTLHGRPAGFRTHALVCVASALLMVVTVYQLHWMTEVPIDTIRADPTRMAQGIMTGIGFLGAGVIFKEGLNVRGLTTAASIWITAAIGILIGIGFYFPAVAGAIITLAVLGLFRFIESKLPAEFYAHHLLRFERAHVISENDVRKLIGKYGFSVANLSSRLTDDGKFFEYRMTIRCRDNRATEKLSQHLRGLQKVIEFRITPVGG
jgi:putative Mg2+ transporter-C (MgtC) family protein